MNHNKVQNNNNGSQLLGWVFVLAVQFFNYIQNLLDKILTTVTFGYINHCPDWITLIIALILFIVAATLLVILLTYAVKITFRVICFVVSLTITLFYASIDALIATISCVIALISGNSPEKIQETYSTK